jgi:NAD+ diphosphatase
MTERNKLGFIDGALDRASERRADPSWVEEQCAAPASRFVGFIGDRPAIDVSGGSIRTARFSREQAQTAGFDGVPVLLGLDEAGHAVFAVHQPASEADNLLGDPFKLIDLRSLALQGALPAGELGMLAQARSVLFWHERHRFCAVCGAATRMADAGYRRHCDACGGDHFPRTDPVVIIVVIRNGKCLLGRGPGFAEGVYSALAGFMEPGETIETAARREVLEETSIRTGRIDYVVSQPWPFPSSLMIGLIGEGLNDDITIDPVEIEDARWFDLPELKAMLNDSHDAGLRTPPVMAIAHHLVIEAINRL